MGTIFMQLKILSHSHVENFFQYKVLKKVSVFNGEYLISEKYTFFDQLKKYFLSYRKGREEGMQVVRGEVQAPQEREGCARIA